MALYELDFDSANHPFYVDVASFLDNLRDRGTAVAVVSDIHFDFRPEFEAADLDGTSTRTFSHSNTASRSRILGSSSWRSISWESSRPLRSRSGTKQAGTVVRQRLAS